VFYVTDLYILQSSCEDETPGEMKKALTAMPGRARSGQQTADQTRECGKIPERQ